MPNRASNAVVGKPSVLGGIFVAPLGTALPTNESTNLNAAFTSVGYLTDSGFSRSRKSDSDTKRAWGGDTIAVIDKGRTRTAKFGFAEYLSGTVQKLIYGDAQVTETAATTTAGRKLAILDKDIVLPHLSWVIQIAAGAKTGRIVYPDAQLTDFDDITYKDDDIAAFPVTLTQFSDTSGVFAYEYWDDGQKSAS